MNISGEKVLYISVVVAMLLTVVLTHLGLGEVISPKTATKAEFEEGDENIETVAEPPPIWPVVMSVVLTIVLTAAINLCQWITGESDGQNPPKEVEQG